MNICKNLDIYLIQFVITPNANGYALVCASSGKEASEILTAHGSQKEGYKITSIKSLGIRPDRSLYYSIIQEGISTAGESNYEIAKRNGFEGSEAEWLKSIRGEKGDPGEKGKSVYEEWLAQGNSGTLIDFLNTTGKFGIIDIQQVDNIEDPTKSILKITYADGQSFEFTIQNGSKGADGNSIVDASIIATASNNNGVTTVRFYMTDGSYTDIDFNQYEWQNDGSFMIWRSDSDNEPTSTDIPENMWATEKDRLQHIGDVYINSEQLCWEYSYLDMIGYYWRPITDKHLLECLNIAKAKARVVAGVYPTNIPNEGGPYQEGDLWVNATYGTKYENDILVCINKGTWESFKIEDWYPASDVLNRLQAFIDNTYLPFVSEIRKGLFEKKDTYMQDIDPSIEWEDNKEAYRKTLWYDTVRKRMYIYDGEKWIDI